MDLGSAIRVLLRRWLVLLVGLVITVGTGYYFYSITPPNYQGTARMLLLLPSTAQSRGDEVIYGSPFLYLPQSLNILAEVAISAPASLKFRDGLDARGLPSDFEVKVDNQHPIISVSVEGQNPNSVITTRDEVLDAIEAELLDVQEEASTPTRQLAYSKRYASANAPEHMSGSGLRGVLAVTAVGGLVTLVAAFGIDRLSQVRGERRARRAIDKAADAPGQDTTSQDSPEENTAGSGGGSP